MFFLLLQQWLSTILLKEAKSRPTILLDNCTKKFCHRWIDKFYCTDKVCYTKY